MIAHDSVLIGRRQVSGAAAQYLLAHRASLKLHPYIEVTTPVMETEVSPDGRILVVEHEYEKHTPEQHRKLEDRQSNMGSRLPPRTPR